MSDEPDLHVPGVSGRLLLGEYLPPPQGARIHRDQGRTQTPTGGPRPPGPLLVPTRLRQACVATGKSRGTGLPEAQKNCPKLLHSQRWFFKSLGVFWAELGIFSPISWGFGPPDLLLGPPVVTWKSLHGFRCHTRVNGSFVQRQVVTGYATLGNWRSLHLFEDNAWYVLCWVHTGYARHRVPHSVCALSVAATAPRGLRVETGCVTQSREAIAFLYRKWDRKWTIVGTHVGSGNSRDLTFVVSFS